MHGTDSAQVRARQWCESFAASVVSTGPGEFPGEVECLINGEAVDLRDPESAIGWAEDMRLLLVGLFVRVHAAGAMSILGNLSEHVSEHPAAADQPCEGRR